MAEKKRSRRITIGQTTIQAETLLGYLEDLAARLNIRLVYDRGSFRGGSCVVHEERVIVVNKQRPIEERLRVLARGFSTFDLEGVYMVPVLRSYLERVQESLFPPGGQIP
ncbi:MAG: hypothetical protein D6762_08645 [Candidatus Neomarinimicrobiota bacterium]|nr:MAG: hypothetical protein D6762_08645 [Candidatus Neomarinimicrobiota bacterium]